MVPRHSGDTGHSCHLPVPAATPGSSPSPQLGVVPQGGLCSRQQPLEESPGLGPRRPAQPHEGVQGGLRGGGTKKRPHFASSFTCRKVSHTLILVLDARGRGYVVLAAQICHPPAHTPHPHPPAPLQQDLLHVCITVVALISQPTARGCLYSPLSLTQPPCH